MFETRPNKILYWYGVYQPLFEQMEKTLTQIEFHKGVLPSELLEEYSHSKHCNIIVLDDLMDDVVSNTEMEKLFTLGAHHKRLIVIYLNQNMYCKGSKSKTINLNTHFLVLMRNPRDLGQLHCLSRQVGKKNLIVEAYMDCMKVPYNYLAVDLSPDGEEEMRVRSGILPDEDTVIYRGA